MDKRWYVVQTKPNQEKTAVYELIKQHFNTFLPTYVTRNVNSKGKTIEKYLPLFPSYIFVEFDPRQQAWKCINGTRGIIGLIGMGETYAVALPTGYVEKVKEQCQKLNTELDPFIDQILQFHKGQQVEVKYSLFKGMVGTIYQQSGKRIDLLLGLLGREIVVQLPIESVKPI